MSTTSSSGPPIARKAGRWQRYAMTVTAPIGSPNPVYSARVAFVAGTGDTVDIDRVAIGATPAVPVATWARSLLVVGLSASGILSLLRSRKTTRWRHGGAA